MTREVVIHQGNKDLPEKISQVSGMDASQVRALLGPPQSRWNIGGEVWIYYYRDKGRDRDNSFVAEVMFDENGKVASVKVEDGRKNE